ncbi:hypothetical protein [Lysinibacillus mangiferihumi]|uniref:hypothetical protein n=1 Tax=Lysinibacillus mangiferihumi TaxID=1130819 RepID=UPI00142D9ECE|nr:hypothetical protein [Lysinibacillus mangiferihumi]
MDKRVQKAFMFAELHLQQRMEFWTSNNNQEAMEHYQNELVKLKADLDELIKESTYYVR